MIAPIPSDLAWPLTSVAAELRRSALDWLAVTDADRKAAGVAAMRRAWQQGRLALDA